jgi:polyisoprenoid-binding protein YceI
MTRITRFSLSALTGLMVMSAPLLKAQETEFQIDPAQTKIEFTLGSVLHTVHGTFQLKGGNLRFDPATGKASGELVVDARSGASGSNARDSRMHKDILESQRFPEIVFRPDRIEGKVASAGVSQVVIHGVFTIHGGQHELAVPAEVQAAAGKYGVTAHFEVPYQKWGMKNPSTFILRVNDKVDLTVQTVAHPVREVTTR